MATQPPLDTALDYIARGWSPIPVPTKTKRPIVPEWQKLRITEDTADKYFGQSPQNIGVLLGEPSGGLIDIDLDCGQTLFLADRFLPPTEGIFGRAGKPRSHRLYQCSQYAETKRFKDVKPDENNRQATLVEYRSTGAQTVFPGSIHDSGEAIEWENYEPYVVDDGHALLRDVSKLASASLIARHWPGAGSRHDARVALAGGLLRAGWSAADCKHFIKSVEMIVPHQAKDAETDSDAAVDTSADRIAKGDKMTGWPTLAKCFGEYGDAVVRAVREWLGIVEEAASDIAVYDDVEHDAESDKPIPQHLLTPHGLVGEMVAWINATSHRYQPIFALGNTLAFWGAVVGRKVALDRLRTNIYAVGVGPSGSGKDWSRKAVKQVAEAAGVDALLGGEDVSSDTALYRAAARAKSCLFQIDELGHFVSNLNSKTSSTHQRSIAPAFTKLFSSADCLFIGKEFADGERLSIDQPNVCLYGTTTPGQLYASLTPSQVEDGFLARILAFRTRDLDPEATGNRSFAPPASLVEAVINWHSRNDFPRAPGNLAAVTKHIPHQVELTGEAASEFAKLERLARERKSELRPGATGLDSLWARATEHARKIALTIAAGCAFEPGELRITGDVACYSCELATFLLDDFVHAIKGSVAGSEYERDVQATLRVIRASGIRGVTTRELMRATQKMSGRQRDDVLKHLLESGQVGKKEGSKPTRGPKPTIYFAAKVAA